MGNFPWHSTSEGAKQSSTRASGKRSRSAALQSVRVRAGIIVGVFVLLAFFVFNVAYADRVQPGVSSLGVDLGSKPQTDVKSLLNSEFKTISQQEVILRYEADIWRLTPGALGLTLDADATVKKAMAAGQSSNPIQGVTSKLGIGVKPQVVEPVLIVDRTRASAALADIIAKIDRPGKVDQFGSIIEPSSTGRSLTPRWYPRPGERSK